MKDCLVELIYVVIGLELIVAGVGKLVWRPNPEQFVPWLPARARMAGAVVPYFEGATGIALLSLSPPLPVVALAFALYISFTAHHLSLTRGNSRLSCGCGVFADANNREAAIVTGVKAAGLGVTLVIGIPEFPPPVAAVATTVACVATVALWLRGRFVARRVRARVQHVWSRLA